MTMAVGWAGLFNGMGGENSSKLSPKDFLPYPNQIEDKTRHKLSASSQIILRSLGRSGKLKPQILAVLQPLISEVNR